MLLQIKKRKKDAEEPTKYMGCGDCDNLSRSITVSCYHENLWETMMIVFFSLTDTTAGYKAWLINFNIDAIGACPNR